MTTISPTNYTYTPSTTFPPIGPNGINYGQQLLPPGLNLQGPELNQGQGGMGQLGQSVVSTTDPSVKPNYSFVPAAATNANAGVNTGLNFPSVPEAPTVGPMFPNQGGQTITTTGAPDWNTSSTGSVDASKLQGQPFTYASDITPQSGMNGTTGAVGVNPTATVQAYGAPVIAPNMPKADLTTPAPPAGVGSTLNVIA